MAKLLLNNEFDWLFKFFDKIIGDKEPRQYYSYKGNMVLYNDLNIEQLELEFKHSDGKLTMLPILSSRMLKPLKDSHKAKLLLADIKN